jgi:hypothetical protein
VVGEEKVFDEGVDVVELGYLDDDGWYGGRAASDELDVACGCGEDGATALGVLPTLSLLKPEGGKEAAELVKVGALGDCAD